VGKVGSDASRKHDGSCAVVDIELLCICQVDLVQPLYADDQAATEKKPEITQQTITIKGRVLKAQTKEAASTEGTATPSQESVGVPDCKVTMQLLNTQVLEQTTTTDEQGNYQFALSLPQVSQFYIGITASSADQSEMSFMMLNHEDYAHKASFDLTLMPACQVQIKVVDAQDKILPESNIGILTEYNRTIFGKTDAGGMFESKFPPQHSLQAIMAWSDGKGMDYHVFESHAARIERITSATKKTQADVLLTLKLTGAKPLQIKVMNGDKPVPGVALSPWIFSKETELDILNLSFFAAHFIQKTNEQGEVQFNWLPEWQKKTITFWPHAEDYAHLRSEYNPLQHNGEFVIKLQLMVPIRGHVTYPDGKPAIGVNVTASGANHTYDSGYGNAVTDNDGSYDMKVTPETLYIIQATQTGWISNPLDGIVVHQTPLDGKDLVLRKPTRLYGKVLDDKTGEPVAGQSVSVGIHGPSINAIPGETLVNPKGQNTNVAAVIYQSAQSKPDGSFEFLVSQGKYRVKTQSTQAVEVEIRDETEMEVNLKAIIVSKQLLKALVVQAESKTALPNVMVEGSSLNSKFRQEIKSITAADGTIEVNRYKVPLILYAHSKELHAAGLVHVEADQSDVVIPLNEMTQATGRLLDHKTELPLSGKDLEYGINIEYINSKGLTSTRYGGRVVTDDDGKFMIPDIAQGVTYTLSLVIEKDGNERAQRWRKLTTFQANSASSHDMGDIRGNPDLLKYVPPTPEERMQQAFVGPGGTPLERNTKALENIKHIDQHVLIVFGEPKQQIVKSFFEYRYNNTDFRRALDDFSVMAVPLDAEHRAAALELAKHYNVELTGNRENFCVLAVNEQGQAMEIGDAENLCTDGVLSLEKLTGFIKRHEIPRQDAKELVDAAFKQAKAENKRVILQESATWCGPCHMLTRYMHAHPVWEKDYILVRMDHRWIGAMDIMKGYREEAQGGIPWFVILDAEGNKLITSNHYESKENIGFPSEATGKAHFKKMLELTRIRLTDAEIQDMINELK
jgi:hypothetical protein